MEYEHMRAMEKTHVCAICGGEPVTTWDSENDCYRLACGKDKTHNGFNRRVSAQKALQRGQIDDILGPGAQNDLEKRAGETSTALRLLPRADLGSGQVLTVIDIGELVEFARGIGLNANLGHVVLFYGKPYPTIDGYYYLNHKRKKPYHIGVRPMTAEEKTANMTEEATHAYIAHAWLDGVELPDDGIGFVTADEINEMSKKQPSHYRSPIVHQHPQRMAEKRAEWQLLRKLIPLEVKE